MTYVVENEKQHLVLFGNIKSNMNKEEIIAMSRSGMAIEEIAEELIAETYTLFGMNVVTPTEKTSQTPQDLKMAVNLLNRLNHGSGDIIDVEKSVYKFKKALQK